MFKVAYFLSLEACRFVSDFTGLRTYQVLLNTKRV